MGMLTIGAFAKACRLSPKALRLYDELDLLRPARVDPHTGYRYYAPEQLERARLVAWLRRVGMPLAGIRRVCSSTPLRPPRRSGRTGPGWRRRRPYGGTSPRSLSITSRKNREGTPP
ncbi:hypothetical protein SHKM778_76280 [Streptomyces sp. KM77-8]|uniref:HTH merR-type domain-containing protein n=1 Tax=Streptomyces haneummycinicus TaxID=3074435 RepID=A0AAT9HUA4_9ACTN